MTHEPLKPTDKETEVPTPVVAGEGVEFINDQCSNAREQAAVIDPGGDHHCLQGFRRGQEKFRRISQHAAACRIGDIAVPNACAKSDKGSVSLKPWLEVVEQSLKWTHVKNRQAVPAFGRHARHQG